MHNLEQSIVEWRKSARATPGVTPELAEELEIHLRETVAELVRSGLTSEEAWLRAVQRLGSLPALSAEFRKVNPPLWWPAKLIVALAAAGTLLLALFLAGRFDGSGSRALLTVHVFAVIVGYTLTLLAGTLGICFVAQRCIVELSPRQMHSLRRVTFGLGAIALVLTVAAVVLGMLWSKAEWGRYWSWDVKEIGGLAVIGWLLLFVLLHFVRSIPGKALLLLSLAGNIVVIAAWFGANLLARAHHYGGANMFWFIVAVTTVHVGVFLMGLAPAGWLRANLPAAAKKPD